MTDKQLTWALIVISIISFITSVVCAVSTFILIFGDPWRRG